MTGIIAEQVARSFGAVHAVQDATFQAREGRITGLVGPNGSGKTTLLLMLASLLAPDRGSIRLLGVDPLADPGAARDLLGWMPDALGAWPSLTAHETLVMTARLYDIPRPRARHRADELLELVGLGAQAQARARVLSRGQKQKLGLARALVHDPRILLLDEPASGLDPQARVDLRNLLRALADQGRTVLISSHVLAELEELIDDAVFFVEGRVVDAAPLAARAFRVRVLPDGEPASGAAEGHALRTRIAEALERPVADIDVDRRDVLVSFETDAEAVVGLQRLVGAGIPVVEFCAAQGGLEQTFLSLSSSPGLGATAPPHPGSATPGLHEGQAS